MGSANVRSQEHIPEGRTPGGLPYVGGLDGLRAFAVVAVLLYHAGVAAVPGGFLGVDVFFVLSGYLITSLLLAERERTGRIDLLRFWARRARRLLPAAVLVVVASVAAIAILHPREAGPLRGDAIASLFYVNNWHQILAERSYFDAFERPSLLQHLWSLAVEEQFYLLWPLALGACLSALGRGRTVAVTLVAGVCSAVFMAFLFQPGTDPSRVYYGTDTHAVGLLVGALLAFAWPLRPLVSVPRRRAAAALDAGAALAGAAVLIAMLTWQDYDPWVYRGGIAVVSIATAVLVAAIAHPASRAGRWLGVAPLLWIGRRSYGIYLWHWPVMALTRPGLDVDASPWLVVPLQFALTFALAAASYKWVEQPFRTRTVQRALRGWLDRRSPRRRLAAVLTVPVVAGVALLGLLSWNPPAPPAPQLAQAPTVAARTPLTTPARAVDNARPLAVGASVMLAAERPLRRFAVVDAAVGRYPGDLIARLEAYRAKKTLPGRVVVQIGENGPFQSGQIKQLREVLRGVSRVVLINVRVRQRWESDVNRDAGAAGRELAGGARRRLARDERRHEPALCRSDAPESARAEGHGADRPARAGRLTCKGGCSPPGRR